MELDQFEGHTPGPLACVELMAFAAGFAVEDGEGRTVARIMKTHGVAPLPSRANAALFAAAPDLLAEVRRLTAEAAALRRERERLEELEAALEALVNRCNAEFVLSADDAVIAAEAALERLYRARKAVRDDVVAPAWTALIARPAPAQRVSAADELAPAAAPQQGEPVQGPVWLTDERIAQIAAQTWGSAGIAPQSAAAFARAIEAWMLGASSPWSAAPERATDLDADIIEAQRAVVQQLASRPACDWPGKCAHKRPAPAAAPERAGPADGCGACGDSCRSRGSCRLADESPRPAAELRRGLEEMGVRLIERELNDPARKMPRIPCAQAAAPERAEPDHLEDARGMVCATSGLLGATSGVGRECGMWIEGVCTSPEPCQHQQQTKPCRCGPDGCPDRVSCPRGGARAIALAKSPIEW